MTRQMKPRDIKGSIHRCPKCGSRKVIFAPDLACKGYGPGLASCANCKALWEPFDPNDQFTLDEPLASFKEPCNNCAFRPGSHEQANVEKWKETMASLKAGGSFYCHKGVPIEAGAEHGFAYPEKIDPAATKMAGQAIKVSDRGKMRICRGYLNMISRQWAREEMKIQET